MAVRVVLGSSLVPRAGQDGHDPQRPAWLGLLFQNPDHHGVDDKDKDEEVQREEQPDVNQLEVARLG